MHFNSDKLLILLLFTAQSSLVDENESRRYLIDIKFVTV